MAAPPPWQVSWKSTVKPTLTSSPLHSATNTRSSSSKPRVINPCRASSSSSNSNNIGPPNSSRQRAVEKPANADSVITVPKNTTTNQKKGASVLSTKGCIDTSSSNIDLLVINENKKRGQVSFRSVFARGALWRKLFSSRKLRSIILLNVITFIYASNIPVVKEVEAVTDPLAFTAVRFALSAVPFIPYVFKAQGDIQTRNAGLELGLWISLGYLTQALGLLTSDAGRASFISMFTVIVVPLLDGMLGSIVPARTWFGALMSLLGVAMLESSGSPPSAGDLLIFLSAVFFGVHMLRTEHISRSTTKENFLPLLGYEVCVVALLSTIWYLVMNWSVGVQELDLSTWSWAKFWDQMVAYPWIPALYTGMFSTGLCLWIEMAAMSDVSATETAIIYGLEPVWGAGFAWFLLGERWGVSGWIGAALVLGGSLTVQIHGASISKSTREGEGSCNDDNDLLTPDKHNSLSASPVVVRSRKK